MDRVKKIEGDDAAEVRYRYRKCVASHFSNDRCERLPVELEADPVDAPEGDRRSKAEGRKG